MSNVSLPEGSSLRKWRDDADWAHIATLTNRGMLAQGLTLLVTADEVAGWLANADDLDVLSDIVFVMDEHDSPAAYAITSSWVEHSGRRIYRHNCKVDPQRCGKGVGSALLEWAITRHQGRDLGAGHLQTEVDNDDPVLTGLLESRGYTPVQHHAELVRPHLDDIPDAKLPVGLESRPVSESQLRTIFDADGEAFRDHWGERPNSEGDYQAFLDFAHRDETMWKVAWDGVEVAGQVRGYINQEENDEFDRKRGWCEFISTARQWRGRGVASALICATLREFARRGLSESALGVHVDNPTGAFALYSKLGFEVVSTAATFEKAVGW